MPQLLFEDNHLLVVEKPTNLLSQADHSGSPDLLSLLKDWIKQRDQKPGQVFLGLVQRLDRPVGGVMVFAKTSKAAWSILLKELSPIGFRRIITATPFGSLNPESPQPSKRFSTMSGLPFMQTRACYASNWKLDALIRFGCNWHIVDIPSWAITSTGRLASYRGLRFGHINYSSSTRPFVKLSTSPALRHRPSLGRISN
jgi:hypothetical protein